VADTSNTVAMFIDGPRHGVVFCAMAWMGLSVLFPVPAEVNLIEPANPDPFPEWPKTAQYDYWGRMGNVTVYKFKEVK